MNSENNKHDVDITLRKIAIIDFVIGFLPLLIHGVLASEPFPAVGLIPLASTLR